MESFILFTNAIWGHMENFNQEHKNQIEQRNLVLLPSTCVFEKGLHDGDAHALVRHIFKILAYCAEITLHVIEQNLSLETL